MFDKQQNETIEVLLERLDSYRWKHQHEKTKDIKRCLQDLIEIDKLIKILNEKFPFSIETMGKIDSEVTNSFYHAMFHLIERIMEFMKNEDESLEHLNIILNSTKEPDSINKIKNEIEFDEKPEKGYAHRVRYWIIRMRKTVRQAYKENRVALLKDFDSILHDAAKYMERVEKYISIEEKIVKDAKKPVRV